jgi:L-galactose dehydrogenase
MQKTTLGRTGLDVSVAALGTGGHSRLGLKQGASEKEAIFLLRAAVDRGVTLIDTAPVYGTEPVVGAALAGRRPDVVLSSKLRVTVPGASYEGTDLVAPDAVRESVEASLGALRTDHIEILHLHGVRPQQYDYCLSNLVPELLKLKDEGKIGFIGITEGFGVDIQREVMRRAVDEGVWDVIMVGHNFVNPSAARLFLPKARANGLGVMCMHAVRGALAHAEQLRVLLAKLVESGEIAPDAFDPAAPLAFLLAGGVARSYTEAAYRFCRHADGIDVVLTGTGKLAHLEQNLADINASPLPEPVLRRLADIFSNVLTASGDPV